MTNTAPSFKELIVHFPSASDISFNDHFIIVENTHSAKKQKILEKASRIFTRNEINDLRIKRDILYVYDVKENRELSQSEIDDMFNANVDF